MPDRKAHWEQIYQDKSPLDVSWYQKEPATSLRLIHNSGIKQDSAIIDVGGGASVLIDRLLNEGYQRLAVLDISSKSLAVAKARLGKKADKVEWYEADITEFKPPHTVSLWHDRAVFHFLTDAKDQAKYVEVLKTALIPGGHLILAAFAIGGPVKCSGLDIVQYDANKLMKELGSEFELLDETSETHITPANTKQRFAYFHLLRKKG